MSTGPATNNNNVPIVPIYDRIPLPFLLEIAVQRTYHELFTMSELLYNRPNIERKKDLITFACRARQMFIRILALIRWAESAETVNTCQSIQESLENRARLIRETSDFLATLARDKLSSARLPNFPIGDSIDVLTLGHVHFLPKRIEDAVTTYKPASETERQEIMPRLQQIIMSKVSNSTVPRQYSDVIIKNGVLKLVVRDEFQVSLGITNDVITTPWTLFKIKILVLDPEEPEQQLLHPVQAQLLTDYVQSWLVESEKPLLELYNYLHYFCQSLRLQVLMEQAHRLRSQGDNHKNLVIQTYVACKRFNIEYWKDFSNGTQNNSKKKQTSNEKTRDIGMSIICDDDGKFSIIHWPPLPVDDSVGILDLLQKPNVAMEEILNRTVNARCQRRFEDLKQIISSNTTENIRIDPNIPAIVCELLPQSSSDEFLYISIASYSGLFRVICQREVHHCQQIEQALNRDMNTLTEAINNLKIYLLQQRIPPLIAHLNCRIYKRVPALNMKNPMISPFVNNSLFIELNRNEGFYIFIHVSDLQQMLLQYYLVIIEKRSLVHESLLIQQQIPTTSQTEEGSKWILEPLLIYSLDTSAFLRRELLDLEQSFRSSQAITKRTDDDIHNDRENSNQRVPSAPIASLKLLVKLVHYYDEMLTLTQLKQQLQLKNILCKNIMYSNWTGIPYLDLVRKSTLSDNVLLNGNLVNYVNEEFWPRIQQCTVRLTYECRENKAHEQLWTLQLLPKGANFFHNFLIQTPFNETLVYNNLSTRVFMKTAECMQSELRKAFEIAQLLDEYATSLNESPDLYVISEISSFKFFSFIIRYGPNLSFAIHFGHSQKYPSKQNLVVSADKKLDFRFTTLQPKLLSNAHNFISRKLITFLAQKSSLKQFVRLLHMTSVSISTIVQMYGFSRPVSLMTPADPLQLNFAFIPYNEYRWRLIFGQTFAIDIQICGPNLILIRDGSFSIDMNESLPDLSPIPGFKEFLSSYADDRGLSFEFFHINAPLRDEDFPFESQSSSLDENEPSQMDTMTINDELANQSKKSSSFGTDSLPDATVTNQFSQSQSDHKVASNSFNRMTDFSSNGENAPAMDPYEFFTAMPPHDRTVQQSNNHESDPAYDLLLPDKDSSNEKQSEDLDEKITISSSTSSMQGYHRQLLTKPQYPVYLSQQTFFKMFYVESRREWSNFESFLIPALLVKRFNRIVLQYPENNRTIRSILNETDSFRIEHLHLQLAFAFDNHLLTYRIQLTSLSDPNSIQTSNFFWTLEELQTLETYFSDNLFPPLKVSPSNVPLVERISIRRSQSLQIGIITFTKMLANIQPSVLKDLVKLIQIEQNPETHHWWRARWCLTMPDHQKDLPNIQPNVCQPDKTSFLFVFEFRPEMINNDKRNSMKFLVPLIYNCSNDETKLWDQSNRCFPSGHETEYEAIKQILSSQRETSNKNHCSLFPSVNDILSRLKIGS